jgi:pimeloyl-ACP methyl ester carboxylesterase
VLIYDRRNCGASDVAIDGTLSEVEIWVDDLHALMGGLEMSPAYVGGESVGCTVSVRLARHYPQDVKGLLLWGPRTSDPVIMRAVADKWYGQCIELAQRGGMAAVIEGSYFGEHLTLSPANRERLLSMDVQAFCAVMGRWRMFIETGGNTPVTGVTEEELSEISVPTLIVPGFDEAHPQVAAETLHRLLSQSELVSLSEVFSAQELTALRQRKGGFLFFRRISPILDDFITRVEAGQPIGRAA